MRSLFYFFFVFTSGVLFYCSIALSQSGREIEEERVKEYLLVLDNKLADLVSKISFADWNYYTNLTEANLQKCIDARAEFSKQAKETSKEVIKFNWRNFTDDALKQKFKMYAILGNSILSEKDTRKLTKIVGGMSKTYSTAKICAYKNISGTCDLALSDITKIFENSQDPEELKYVWAEYRKVAGSPSRHFYKQYVELVNKAAALNNFTDGGAYWLQEYDDEDASRFKAQIESIWQQLRPLYLQIHAYMRFHLRQKYGEIVPEKGPIPAHLLGSNWAQNWRSLGKDYLPYLSKAKKDLSAELKKQNYTVVKMFKTAEDFFTSINLTKMPDSFWNDSIFEKVKDRDMSCHPVSLDFRNGIDFRISFCAEIKIEHFIAAHHEMGHIEYFLQYKDLPFQFKRGANSGFHEAIGDLISLSVISHKHLHKIGLLRSATNDPEDILNNLFMTGLQKIVSLPISYLVDRWRWDVFNGNITSENYNCKWLELLENLQGVQPPLQRTEEAFDPGAIYHISCGISYIRYFVSSIIQFQFHQALCKVAGEYEPDNPLKPLHECDIYQHPEAGNALKKLLRLGSSKPWPDAMEVLTGKREMDPSGLLEYFKPLHDWLKGENKKNNAFIGWEKSNEGYC